MNLDDKIYIAGHKGLVGSAIIRKLKSLNYHNLVFASHSELDLCDANAVNDFFSKEKPDYTFLAAAKVGGILANQSSPVDFLADNLKIELNIIDASYRHNCKKLLFLGSSCIYPKFAEQPISEESLLSGPLEPTNEWYAVAKIAGIKLCQAYRKQYNFNAISCMPTNLYGPNDNFDLKTSHVLPALIRKFHEAKEQNNPEVTIWGTGSPKREFLHVDDLAEACIFLMNQYNNSEIINIGTGKDITIKELAEIIKEVTGFGGSLTFDSSKPDGTPRKVLNTSKINTMGWQPKISLKDGIKSTYDWFCK